MMFVILRILIKQGANVNAKDANSDTPLHIAAAAWKVDSTEIILELIHCSANVNAVNKFNKTPLQLAAEFGQHKELKILLEFQKDLYLTKFEFQNNNSSNQNNHKKCLELLIRHKVKYQEVETPKNVAAIKHLTELLKIEKPYLFTFNPRNDSEKNIYNLNIAAAFGQHEQLKEALEIPSCVDGNMWGKNTPLHFATQEKHFECFETLLEKGASLMAENDENETALLIACKVGAVDCLRLILKSYCLTDHSSEIRRKCSRRRFEGGLKKALEAVIKKNIEKSDLETKQCSELLIRNGVLWEQINEIKGFINDFEKHKPYIFHFVPRPIRDRYKLHVAAGKGELNILRTLANCNINAKTSSGRYTALHFACQEGHYQCVDYLIERGADVNSQNIYDQTPLHLASAPQFNVSMEHLEKCCEILIQAHAMKESENFAKQTPLHVAAHHGRTPLLKLLLDMGSNIDAADCIGDTALHLAVSHGQIACVQALLDKGPNINKTNKREETPLHLASRFKLNVTNEKLSQCCELLLQKEADCNMIDFYGNTPLDYAILKNLKETKPELFRKPATD